MFAVSIAIAMISISHIFCKKRVGNPKLNVTVHIRLTTSTTSQTVTTIRKKRKLENVAINDVLPLKAARRDDIDIEISQ